MKIKAKYWNGKRPKGSGWLEIREIRGRLYAYWRWRDGKRKMSKYLGLVNKVSK